MSTTPQLHHSQESSSSPLGVMAKFNLRGSGTPKASTRASRDQLPAPTTALKVVGVGVRKISRYSFDVSSKSNFTLVISHWHKAIHQTNHHSHEFLPLHFRWLLPVWVKRCVEQLAASVPAAQHSVVASCLFNSLVPSLI